MTVYYDHRAEAERKARDTPAQIVHIARSKGYFDVSHRWRDGWLTRRCMELVRLGFLKRGRQKAAWQGSTRYFPSQKWYWKIHGKPTAASAAGEVQTPQGPRPDEAPVSGVVDPLSPPVSSTTRATEPMEA